MCVCRGSGLGVRYVCMGVDGSLAFGFAFPDDDEFLALERTCMSMYMVRPFGSYNLLLRCPPVLTIPALVFSNPRIRRIPIPPPSRIQNHRLPFSTLNR